MYYYYLFSESFCPLKNLVVTRFILSIYIKGYYMYIETSRPRQAGDRARFSLHCIMLRRPEDQQGPPEPPTVSLLLSHERKQYGEPGLNSHSEKDKDISILNLKSMFESCFN